MALAQTTPPSEEPVSLSELKAHLRVTGTSEDTLITSLGIAARQTLEARYGLGIVSQDWRLSVSANEELTIALPLAPVAAVTAVTIANGDTETLLTTNQYDVETGTPGHVYLKSVPVADSITIDFVVGWTDATNVPDAIKLAIKMLAAHYFEHREALDSERTIAGPESIAALMAPYKRVRL